MNERQLTITEAWEDFIEVVVGGMKARNERIPNEISVARRTALGSVMQKSGKVKTLGATRIRRLLEKYAPGRYEFKSIVIIHEKGPG